MCTIETGRVVWSSLMTKLHLISAAPASIWLLLASSQGGCACVWIILPAGCIFHINPKITFCPHLPFSKQAQTAIWYHSIPYLDFPNCCDNAKWLVWQGIPSCCDNAIIILLSWACKNAGVDYICNKLCQPRAAGGNETLLAGGMPWNTQDMEEATTPLEWSQIERHTGIGSTVGLTCNIH